MQSRFMPALTWVLASVLFHLEKNKRMNYLYKDQQLRQVHTDMQKLLTNVRTQLSSGLLSDREAMLMRSVCNNLSAAISRMEYMLASPVKA